MGEFTQSKKRARWRSTLILAPYLFAVLLAFAGAEYFARNREQGVRLNDRVDPGLTRYESTLGWALTPNWSGNHENADYRVRYQVNYAGFRADSPLPVQRQGTLVAVLGDSFTFGFGVNDDQTFVHHLNQQFTGKATFINCATPGYSTDQEALLLENAVLGYKPDVVLLAVYLGNDLLDCPRPFPIQASLGKPYFSVEDGELRLNNVPVPQVPKGPSDAARELQVAVLGEQTGSPTLLDRLARRSALLTVLRDRYVPAPDHSQLFATRFADELDLFFHIVLRMQRACEVQGSTLSLALLSGRSFVESPGSLSAQYQEHFRASILEWARSASIETIDVAGSMRDDYDSEEHRWFFPNDGHFTPDGHEYVANQIASGLTHLTRASAPL